MSETQGIDKTILDRAFPHFNEVDREVLRRIDYLIVRSALSEQPPIPALEIATFVGVAREIDAFHRHRAETERQSA